MKDWDATVRRERLIARVLKGLFASVAVLGVVGWVLFRNHPVYLFFILFVAPIIILLFIVHRFLVT